MRNAVKLWSDAKKEGAREVSDRFKRIIIAAYEATMDRREFRDKLIDLADKIKNEYQ